MFVKMQRDGDKKKKLDVKTSYESALYIYMSSALRINI